MSTEIEKVRTGIDAQLKKTDEVIVSNEAIADVISELNNSLSEVQGTLASGFSMIATGLQEVYFAIDDGFREVCYKLDLQNEALTAIKKILERPLDTQAKELRKRAEFAYLNGWIDEAEVDLLESIKKNYQDFIALHILGNINYHKKNYWKALEYYQKAAKYAAPQSKKGACKALLYSAEVYKELGKVEDAYQSTRLAMDMLPDDTHNLFNHAAYASMMRYTDKSIDHLRKAAIKDPTCLIAADSDERFSHVKQEKEQLKRDLRDRQREAVEHLMQKINSLKRDFESAKRVADDVGITDFTVFVKDLASLDDNIAEINKLYMRDSYFDLLKAEQVTRDAYDRSLKDYEKHVKEWMNRGSISLDNLKAKVNEIENKKYCGWGFFITVIVGILAYIILNNTPLGELGEPKKIGPPKKVLTFTSDARYKSSSIEKGYSFEVVSETDNKICLRYPIYGVVCEDRNNLFKFAKLEMGYFNDYSWMLPAGVQQLLVFVFPFIVGILSSILIKSKNLNAPRSNFKKVHNAFKRLSALEERYE